MSKRIVISLIVAFAFTATTRSVRAESLQDVEKKIHDKLAKAKSIQYKSKGTSSVSMGEGSTKTDMEMTVEYKKDGDKILSRTETKSKMVINMSGTEQKTDSTMIAVSDGKVSHVLSESNGQKQIVKQNVNTKDQPNPFDQMSLFKMMEQTYNMKLLPDEKVDGKTVYAIETTAKDEAMKAYIGRTVSYYDQSNGLPVKTVQYDSKGKLTGTFTMTDIKVDADIKPDRFVFKAPEGVPITDMTAMGKDSEHNN